jgi:predicted RNA-binding protein YlqC (UPF0109 family)
MNKTIVKTMEKTKLELKIVTATEKLKEAIKLEAECWVDIAVLAHEIYESKEWEGMGYENLKEYIEKELKNKISYEVFLYRAKIGKVIKKYGFKKDEIVDIGWAKFKEIAALAQDEEDIEEIKKMIDEVKDKSYREAKQIVDKKRGLKNKIVRKFKLNSEQEEVINEAIEIAKELAHTDIDEVAIIYIMSEFITNHAPENSKIAKAIRTFLKSMEVQHER